MQHLCQLNKTHNSSWQWGNKSVNSLPPAKCGCDYKCVNFKHNLQCRWKTCMVHQTFVWWALYIPYKFVKSSIRHFGLAIGNVRYARRFFCLNWTWELTIKLIFPRKHKWMTEDLVNGRSKGFDTTLCCQTTSHCLKKIWLSSRTLGHNELTHCGLS